MAINDITGDSLITKTGNRQAYSDNYDRIFGKKTEQMPKEADSCLMDSSQSDSGLIDSVLMDSIQRDDVYATVEKDEQNGKY